MAAHPGLAGEEMPTVVAPTTVAGAVEQLAAGAPSAVPLAGGTWIMRSGVRGETLRDAYVSLASVPELRQLDLGPPLRIGACVTHARLASAVAGNGALRGLQVAAGRSANPAIREVATVGGNLATSAFAAADLVPALLALDAEVTVAGPGGTTRMPVPEFLAQREALAPGTLVTDVVVSRLPARSAHARLTLRSAGDYPVAIVSVARGHDEDARGGALRIAVGSVERVPRRWHELEAELAASADAAGAAAAAERLSAQLDARHGVEVPGWYRTRVLPALVRRAVAELTTAPDR